MPKRKVDSDITGFKLFEKKPNDTLVNAKVYFRATLINERVLIGQLREGEPTSKANYTRLFYNNGLLAEKHAIVGFSSDGRITVEATRGNERSTGILRKSRRSKMLESNPVTQETILQDGETIRLGIRNKDCPDQPLDLQVKFIVGNSEPIPLQEPNGVPAHAESSLSATPQDANPSPKLTPEIVDLTQEDDAILMDVSGDEGQGRIPKDAHTISIPPKGKLTRKKLPRKRRRVDSPTSTNSITLSDTESPHTPLKPSPPSATLAHAPTEKVELSEQPPKKRPREEPLNKGPAVEPKVRPLTVASNSMEGIRRRLMGWDNVQPQPISPVIDKPVDGQPARKRPREDLINGSTSTSGSDTLTDSLSIGLTHTSFTTLSADSTTTEVVIPDESLVTKPTEKPQRIADSSPTHEATKVETSQLFGSSLSTLTPTSFSTSTCAEIFPHKENSTFDESLYPTATISGHMIPEDSKPQAAITIPTTFPDTNPIGTTVTPEVMRNVVASHVPVVDDTLVPLRTAQITSKSFPENQPTGLDDGSMEKAVGTEPIFSDLLIPTKKFSTTLIPALELNASVVKTLPEAVPEPIPAISEIITPDPARPHSEVHGAHLEVVQPAPRFSEDSPSDRKGVLGANELLLSPMFDVPRISSSFSESSGLSIPGLDMSPSEDAVAEQEQLKEEDVNHLTGPDRIYSEPISMQQSPMSEAQELRDEEPYSAGVELLIPGFDLEDSDSTTPQQPLFSVPLRKSMTPNPVPESISPIPEVQPIDSVPSFPNDSGPVPAIELSDTDNRLLSNTAVLAQPGHVETRSQSPPSNVPASIPTLMSSPQVNEGLELIYPDIDILQEPYNDKGPVDADITLIAPPPTTDCITEEVVVNGISEVPPEVDDSEAASMVFSPEFATPALDFQDTTSPAFEDPIDPPAIDSHSSLADEFIESALQSMRSPVLEMPTGDLRHHECPLPLPPIGQVPVTMENLAPKPPTPSRSVDPVDHPLEQPQFMNDIAVDAQMYPKLGTSPSAQDAESRWTGIVLPTPVTNQHIPIASPNDMPDQDSLVATSVPIANPATNATPEAESDGVLQYPDFPQQSPLDHPIFREHTPQGKVLKQEIKGLERYQNHDRVPVRLRKYHSLMKMKINGPSTHASAASNL